MKRAAQNPRTPRHRSKTLCKKTAGTLWHISAGCGEFDEVQLIRFTHEHWRSVPIKLSDGHSFETTLKDPKGLLLCTARTTCSYGKLETFVFTPWDKPRR